jgi:hypothetical protein
MPNSSYGGRSQFFETPAGRALTDLSLGGAPRGAAGGFPGGAMESMRPSLRNALSDAAGEEMLNNIRRRQPWVSHDEGNPDVPGMFGQPRDFYVDPAVAAGEDSRQRNFMGAMQEFDLDYGLKDTAARRGAVDAQDIADYTGRREASRYFDPMQQAVRGDDFRRKLQLSTEPARIAADSRADVATAQADARVSAAQAGERARMFASSMDLIPELTRSGVFGRDRRGNPIAPDPEVSQQAIETMRRILSGGGRAGGAGGAGMGGGMPGGGMMPGGGGAPQITPEMEPYIQAGYSPEEVIAHFQKTGRIR